MSEKRFKSTIDEDTMSIMPYIVSDNEKECFYNLQDCVDLLNKQQAIISDLKEENKQLLCKLQQMKEYLQAKIDECKNPKKMKEITFGVEQEVGYKKALLGFQKGLKRRWNDD